MTTGKKLHTYQYKVMARGLKLDAAKTNYKTLHISNEAAQGDDKKQLWLAQDQYYLPVRYKLTDEDGNNFEQTLTKIHVE
jgi:outer membrane lipoprotein-sorting protein